MGSDRLRFALVRSGSRLEPWHLCCLRHLWDCASLVGVAEVPVESKADGPSSTLGHLRGAPQDNPAQEIDSRPSNAPRLNIDGGRLTPEPETLDFVLKLGRGPVPPGLRVAARYGLWCFEHECSGDSIPFLREIYEGEDVTEALLLAIRFPEHPPAVLERGWFRTEKRSHVRHAERVQASIAEWPARICRRLLAQPEGGLSAAPADALRPHPIRRSDVPFHRFCARIARRRLEFAWRRLFRHNQWNVGVLPTPVETILASGVHTDEKIQWFPLAGHDGFLADPFGIERDGTLHMLCEYFDYRSARGRICTIEFTRRRFSTEPVDAITLPVHMSYPYLLEEAGKIYCVPETCAVNEVALYRAVEFPHTWSKAAVLVGEFPGVDPSVFRHEDRWWLLCTRRGPQQDVELWVWHAAGLLGPWIPHVRNPVKVDVRGTRPGGTPFVRDGVLYRPAQDCSRDYGGRIVIHRVIRLTPTEFREEPAAVIEPSRNSRFPAGRHTLSPVGDAVLIDGHRAVFAWPAFVTVLKIFARNLLRIYQ